MFPLPVLRAVTEQAVSVTHEHQERSHCKQYVREGEERKHTLANVAVWSNWI